MGPTNVGLWDRWYSLPMPEPQPYGDSPTYELGAAWLLATCDTIADWGCGKGWLRRFVPADRYHGIDGSASPYADEIVDLVGYRDETDGVFLRHVLEHDYRWREILRAATTCARRRLVVVLFTPPAERTSEIAWNADPGVPDLSFAVGDLLAELDGFSVSVDYIDSPATQYETETLLFAERNNQ